MNRQRSRADHITWPKLLRSTARQALLRPPAEAPAPVPVDAELVETIGRQVAIYRGVVNAKPKAGRRSRRAAEMAAKPR